MSTQTGTSNGSTTTRAQNEKRTQTRTNQTTGTTTGTEQPEKAAVTTSKLADAAHRAVDSVAAQVAEAERRLRDSASENKEALGDVAGTYKDKAGDIKDRTREYIDNNPVAAAGIAFVAGIIFSAWMRK